MPRPAPDPFAEDRVEDRAHRQRQPLVIGKERQRERDDGIDRPGVQAPVEDRRGHPQRVRRGGIALGPAQGRPVGAHAVFQRDPAECGGIMRDRLAYAVEHEADAHSGRKKHGEPASIAVIGRGVPAADPHLAQGRDDQAQADQHEDIARQQEEPVEGRGEEIPHAGKDRTDGVLEGHGDDDESHHRQARHGKDWVVDVQTQKLDVVLTDLVIGLDQVCRPLGGGYGVAVGGIGQAFPPFWLSVSLFSGGVSHRIALRNASVTDMKGRKRRFLLQNDASGVWI